MNIWTTTRNSVWWMKSFLLLPDVYSRQTYIYSRNSHLVKTKLSEAESSQIADN